MKFSSDLTVFAPAAAADRVSLAASAWAPASLDAAMPSADGPQLDPEEQAALRHAQELEAAYTEGYAAGAAQARAQVEEALRAALAAADDAAAQLGTAEAGRLAALHADLATLAVAVAHHLIGREVKDGQVVADLVRRALAEFPLQQAVRVRINPHDLSTLTAAKAPDGSALPVAAGRDLTWVPDPELGRGGVIVEGRERIVDGRVDLALERVYRRLADG